MNKNLLSHEACAILGVHRETLVSWARKGLLKPRKGPLGWRLYDQAEVEKLKERISSKRQPGVSALVGA